MGSAYSASPSGRWRTRPNRSAIGCYLGVDMQILVTASRKEGHRQMVEVDSPRATPNIVLCSVASHALVISRRPELVVCSMAMVVLRAEAMRRQYW